MTLIHQVGIFILVVSISCNKGEVGNDGPPPSGATELEDDPFNDIVNNSTAENRHKRFFWPAYEASKVNTNRHLHSYPQSPIVEMMMETMGVNYVPQTTGDPFEFLRDSYPLPKGYSDALDVYDYIIVGAGTAGSVVAARLSEDKPKVTVLVLEAGKPEMLLSDIPALVPYLQQTDYVWPYSMEHQPGVCMGSEGGRCYWARGRGVGGTSLTDYMVYSRGRRQDWDRMVTDGNYGWSYDELLEYFKKSERAELKNHKNTYPRPEVHGHDGEVTVESVPFRTGLVEAFLEAGRIFGNPTVDYNAPDQFGFGYVQTMTNKGHRLSSAKAFLHPHKRRKNLHILTEATAGRVLIEPKSKRAFGVEYFKNNKKHIVRCRREIILSAGPISSPQLLMLSGVGPQEHLRSLGIPVISNVNVGRTLYDHVAFPGIVFELSSNNASLIESKVATLPNLIQWIQYGDGFLASPGGIEAIGYLKTTISQDQESVPDVELVSMGGSIAMDSGGALRKSWKISDQTYNNAFGSLNGADTWSAIPVLLHPNSKGYLELRDTNPFSKPKLYGNYFSDPSDMAAMKEAVNYIIKLGDSQPFKKYAPTLQLPQYSSCKTEVPGSDSYWDCAIRTLGISFNRQIGTCKMGPNYDPEAVVDPELRVYGVEGLRVADSSVIPRTISAHTGAPEIMIGEKAADMIKKSWSNVIT